MSRESMTRFERPATGEVVYPSQLFVSDIEPINHSRPR